MRTRLLLLLLFAAAMAVPASAALGKALSISLKDAA
jgi:hypothetical protein